MERPEIDLFFFLSSYERRVGFQQQAVGFYFLGEDHVFLIILVILNLGITDIFHYVYAMSLNNFIHLSVTINVQKCSYF